ncbi:polysaccharide deacetylase family protein [Micromonospora narathiwatensis]|uniref:Polysaccharide deacetylase n=1 Tax=Micromonospora narathiwatensis TaxID=299146 RepID=A0A1A9A7R8_9ACTN|nr:polysaccharide deacetylase family protein [Micromonospora narathiwatensis]SBT52156.1 Polysaccharide deacetylase [Micromonospora narathiwatensis]
MSATTLRAVGIVTLVAAALLGSAYALGRSLMPETPPRNASVTADGPHYADQPPGSQSATPPPSPSPTADSSPSARSRDQQQPFPFGEGDGPFGSLTSTGSSRIALTFDDGPDPQYTPQVLALLKQYGVKATFCLVGENAQSYPELVRDIVADGHSLCNHSWNHDLDLGQRSPDVIRNDLGRTNEAIRAAAPNARIAYFRQPGGNWTTPVVSVCEDMGMAPLHWAVDPSDWQVPGASQITTTVMTETGPGSIVLMHDAGGDRAGTVEALQRLLPELMSRYQLEALPTGTT